MATTMTADEFLVLTGLGKFLRTQKKHVLQKMRQPLEFSRITVGARIHIH